MKRYFTHFHEWILLDGNLAQIGITPWLERELEEIVHIAFSPLGKRVKPEEEILILESKKAAIAFYAPFSGTLVQTNPNANQSCQNKVLSDQWLYQLEIVIAEQQWGHLMTEDEYRAGLPSLTP